MFTEFAFAGNADFVACAWGDEHADASTLVDDLVTLQDVEGTENSVGVHLVFSSQFANARHPFLFLVLAREDVVAQAVGNLHVDGSFVLVNHRVKNL